MNADLIITHNYIYRFGYCETTCVYAANSSQMSKNLTQPFLHKVQGSLLQEGRYMQDDNLIRII